MVIGLGYFLLGTAPAYSESICSAQREERALDLASRHRDKAARMLEMRTPQVASSPNDEGGMTKERQNPNEKKRPVAPSSSKHSANHSLFSHLSIRTSFVLRCSRFVIFVGQTHSPGVRFPK
jgi:hypothetical protein